MAKGRGPLDDDKSDTPRLDKVLISQMAMTKASTWSSTNLENTASLVR